MATPPSSPPPPNPGNPGGPFPPGDPRNQPYGGTPFQQDPRIQREQAKAWRNYQRDASRQQAKAIRQQTRMAVEAQRAQFRAWRRSNRAQSVIGPLLLIGIATVALLVYNGRIEPMTLLNWFARWWPLVLIAVGVLRLLEWAVARRQFQQHGIPMRFAIGGGTVWLLILLSFLGLAAQGGIHHIHNQWNFGWTGMDFGQLFGSKHEEDAASVTHSIAADGRLEIYSEHGDVTVDGTSDDGRVHLAEHKEVFASDDNRVEGLMSSLDPQFSGTDANLVLRIAGTQNSSAALTLTVPRGVHVVLNSNHGDVAVHSFHAPVAINANHGDVDLSGIAGDVEVRTNARRGEVQIHSVQGAVQLAGSGDEVNLNDIEGNVGVNGDFFGSGHLRHVAGTVNYNAGRISFTARRVDGEVSFDSDDEFTARGVAGPVTIRTRSRNITLDRVSGDLQVANSSGHVDITAVPPTGAITIANRDGDVTLSLPGTAHFSLAADTTDGSIQTSFPGVNGSTNQSHHGNLTTTVGTGGPPVRITTTHGNISLQSNGQTPVPPLPPMVPALTSVPTNLNNSMRDMQRDLAAARTEVDQARKEAQLAARQGSAEAARAATQALAEANRDRDQALAEAAQSRKQAQREADQQRRDALRDAEQARREAQREADQARRDAQHDSRER